MKIYGKQTVYEAALDRIRYLYSEFDDVIVSFSGGKDSTATLHMTIQVARELGKLPVKVCFLDQEAEWQSVVDYIRTVGEMPEVELWWFQMPLRLFNSTSGDSDWLNCWAEGEEWMRPKEPNSIHENTYGCDRFKELFTKISLKEWGDKRIAWVAGVRCEESPARAVALTTAATYKHITWGVQLNKGRDHYTFYPLYDWSYTDVWRAIHHNRWSYCKIYDEQYRYGMHIKEMRVSNLHHETSFASLYYLQEIEKHTWEALCKRLPGINTLGHLKSDAYKVPKEVPSMFKGWRDYRDYLLQALIHNAGNKAKFIKLFNKMDSMYRYFPDKDNMYKIQVNAVLINDYHSTILGNWERRPDINSWRHWMNGRDHKDHLTNKFVRACQDAGIGRVPVNVKR
jgi:predicted phosphoadenosine phosphosulfate sulfurtransferase